MHGPTEKSAATIKMPGVGPGKRVLRDAACDKARDMQVARLVFRPIRGGHL